ncbi:MAG: sugar ABC transporter substrate-binding protein [Clostridia bacterium]|nr:sugar ABC transporter substrate-binding protein [Clostridia bacterium]
MKRIVSLLLSLMMAIMLLAGVTAHADEPIVLQFWGGVQPEYGYDKLVQNFNELYKDKGVQVEYTRYVNNADGNLQLDTYLAAGGMIDIFMGYGGTGRMHPRVDAGNLLDMTDYLAAAGFDPVEELGEAAVAQYVYKDRYWAVPTKYENQLYWFANVQMFEEAGIPLPLDGWTYAEYLDAVEKMTKGEGPDKVYGMYWNVLNMSDTTRNFITAYNKPYGNYEDETCQTTAFDHPDFIAALDLIAKTMQNGWAPSLEEEKADNLSLPTVYLEGKAAMTPAISQIRIIKDLATYPHDFTTAIIPAPVIEEADLEKYGKHDIYNGAGDLICVSSKTEHPDECMEFVLWYIMGGMAPLASGGRIPLWKGFDPQTIVDAMTDGAEGVFDKDSIIAYMEVEKTRAAVALNMPSYAQSEIGTLFIEAYESVLYGQKDAETALKALKIEADELIKKAMAQ